MRRRIACKGPKLDYEVWSFGASSCGQPAIPAPRFQSSISSWRVLLARLALERHGGLCPLTD